jgi:putative peptidoglycan lipid II flippase
MPIVLIRSAVASFQARGDTATPMFISLGAIAVNVALKFLLYRSYGAVGLALATAAGAWINFGGLVALAAPRGWINFDLDLFEIAAAAFCASGLLAAAVAASEAPVLVYVERLSHLRNEALLLALAAIGAVVYASVLGASLKALGVKLRKA